jgi:D-arabinan exo alpha-(1,3)/(1,5)-arabinofuranosidase (non-reducing end)
VAPEPPDVMQDAGADVGVGVDSTTTLPLVVPVGAGALTAIDGLPLLQLDEWSRHASSYDRTGANTDWMNGLGVDAAGDEILLDERGPGCVYRMWFTGFAASDRIRVFFDDEPTPRIEMPLATFFGGQTAPFTSPLVGNGQDSSGGFFSYVPLPFARSLRITATAGSPYYYNIDLHALPPDATVTSWTGAEDLSAARQVWASAGVDPKASTATTTTEQTFDLPPGAAKVLLDLDGPSELTSVELNVPGIARTSDAGVADASAGAGGLPLNLLDALWMKMSWDGESTPSVYAPIGPLFALGSLRPTASGGLMAGMRPDGTLYLYFPMPFAKHAHVELSNTGPAAVEGASVRIGSRPFPDAFDTVGTFAVQYVESASTPGDDLPLLDTPGSGKVVGAVLSEGSGACGQCNQRGYLEGDEHILVDGARTPVVLGTGTEDFFNGGFYFEDGPFGLPTHGNVAHDTTAGGDATSAYRFFISYPIAFRDHVRLSLQHGPTNDVAVGAATLVYYYRQSRARLAQTDGFVVDNAADEEVHGYQVTNQTWSGSFSATFEGEFDSQMTTSTGRAHKGSSFFHLAVDPDNQGVVLRRLLNQTTGNQRAQVFVDGALVGDWFTAGSNAWHPWRECDFVLPASATAGKSMLSIEMRFVSSDVDWNEFEYEAFSLLP